MKLLYSPAAPGTYVLVRFGTVGTQVARIEKVDRLGERSVRYWLRIWRHTSRRWTKTLRECSPGAILGSARSDDPRLKVARETLVEL